MPKKTTKYLPTDIVSYDEKHKQYIISVNDETKEAVAKPHGIMDAVDVNEAPDTPQTESTVEDTMPVDTPVFE